MEIIKPIPKRLLIHEVTYKEHLEGDGWGGEFAEPLTIKFVRVEPTSSISRSSNVDEVIAKNIVFMDKVHTKPFIEPREKSKMTFNGKEFEIYKVNPHYGFKGIHHYEIELK